MSDALSTERPVCADCDGTGHDMSHPTCQMYGCLTCQGFGVLDSEADEHDAFLRKLVDDEFNFKARMAKAIFDLEASAALDLPTLEYMAAYEAANKRFNATIAEARADMPVRLAKLRANDEAENERETPRIITIGDHSPEASQRSAA